MTKLTLMMMMWTTIMNTIEKNTEKMCILLICFSVLSSIMISMMMKMTLIPFITILTLSSGLMVIFLYMTASKPQTKKKEYTLNKPTKISITLALFMIMLTIMNKMNPSKLYSCPRNDPSMELFSQEALPMTSLMMMMLLISLILSMKLCNKPKTSMRQKITIKK